MATGGIANVLYKGNTNLFLQTSLLEKTIPLTFFSNHSPVSLSRNLHHRLYFFLTQHLSLYL